MISDKLRSEPGHSGLFARELHFDVVRTDTFAGLIELNSRLRDDWHRLSTAIARLDSSTMVSSDEELLAAIGAGRVSGGTLFLRALAVFLWNKSRELGLDSFLSTDAILEVITPNQRFAIEVTPP